MVTDNTLRMVNSSYVFALGDIAVQEGDKTSKFAFTAQVAFQHLGKLPGDPSALPPSEFQPIISPPAS